MVEVGGGRWWGRGVRREWDERSGMGEMGKATLENGMDGEGKRGGRDGRTDGAEEGRQEWNDP